MNTNTLNSHISLNSQAKMSEKPSFEKIKYGLSGEIVSFMAPKTEADPVAILVHILAIYGCRVGNSPHFRVENTIHRLRLFPAIVGPTGRGGRKGTAKDNAISVFKLFDNDWIKKNVTSGLSSGEGFIQALSGPEKNKVLIETEFAKILKVCNRKDNTLSNIIRQAWESDAINVLTRANPLNASDIHPVIIGHITPFELQKSIKDVEIANGFANRFLWICSKRTKKLAHGGKFDENGLRHYSEELKQRVYYGLNQKELSLCGDEARNKWEEIYHKFEEDEGMFGCLTGRAEPYILRIAAIYALLDECNSIHVEHLEAAWKLWEYAEWSIHQIWDDASEDRKNEVLDFICTNSQPVSKTELYQFLQNHISKNELDRILKSLTDDGLILEDRIESGGRPMIGYTCCEKSELSE